MKMTCNIVWGVGRGGGGSRKSLSVSLQKKPLFSNENQQSDTKLCSNS